MQQSRERGFLPGPIDSGVGKVIREINGITNNRGWFKPRTLEESLPILEAAQPLFAKLREGVAPFRHGDLTLAKSWRYAREFAFDLASENDRKEWWDEAWERTHDASWMALKRAAGNAVSGDNRRSYETSQAYINLVKNTGATLSRIAAWESISDLIPEHLQNPDSALLGLYRLGLVFVAARFFEHRQVFVAHQIIQTPGDPERYLVCLVENHDTISIRHGINAFCKEGVSIS